MVVASSLAAIVFINLMNLIWSEQLNRTHPPSKMGFICTHTAARIIAQLALVLPCVKVNTTSTRIASRSGAILLVSCHSGTLMADKHLLRGLHLPRTSSTIKVLRHMLDHLIIRITSTVQRSIAKRDEFDPGWGLMSRYCSVRRSGWFAVGSA